MQKETLYNKTVEILVQAYLNDTLQHGNCMACAVGNLVAANCGYKFIANPNDFFSGIEKYVWDKVSVHWVNVHRVKYRKVKVSGSNHQNIWPELYTGLAKYQIDSTGYTFQETAAIEKAFENVVDTGNQDEYMFNGLMAVIDVLDKIHGNKDADTTAATKQKFKRVAV